MFRRLAIFSGSFSLEAVVAVAGEDIVRWDVITTLDRLVAKSMVVAEEGRTQRYRLFETTRLYGRDRLRQKGEDVATADRHADYFIQLLDRADAQWETTPDAEWVEHYQSELSNVRAALDWMLAGSRNVIEAHGGSEHQRKQRQGEDDRNVSGAIGRK